MSAFPRKRVIALLCTLLLLITPLLSQAAFPPESDIPRLDTTFPGMGILPVADDYTARPQLLLAADDNAFFSTINATLTRRLADGTPDPTFGINGTVTLTVNNQPFQPQSLTRDSEGRLVLAGIVTNSGTTNKPQALLRLLPNGIADPDFGRNKDGVVLLGYLSVSEGLPRVVVQQDDRVVVLAADKAGATHPLLRFTSAGNPDPTFGQSGVILLSEDDRDVAVQALGIVVAGVDRSTTPKTVVRRYSVVNGALDLTFGKAGVRVIALGNTTSTYPTHLVRDESDRLWLSLATNEIAQAGTLYTARLTVQGSLDPTYSEDGVASLALTKGIAVSDLVAANDTLLGMGADNTSEAVLFRYLRDGTLDETFGTGGLWLDGADGFAVPGALIRRGDGTLIVAGFHAHPSLQKYTQNGSPDPSFGLQGYVGLRASTMWANSRWLERPDGGRVAYLSGSRFLAFRPNDTLDTSIGTHGLVAPYVNNTRNIDGHMDAQGRFYLIGFTDPTTAPDETASVTRLTPAGTLDSTFGVNGTALIGAPNTSRGVMGAIDAEGRVLVVGTTTGDAFSRQTLLYRVLEDGALDPTFGDNGQVVLANEAVGALHMRYLADGTILVGDSGDGSTTLLAHLYRRLPDGGPDLTFGDGGVVTFEGMSRLNDLVVQPDGRVLVLGYYREVTNRVIWQVFAFTAEGLPDLSFGDAGRVTLRPPGSATGTDVYALTVHPTGRLVVIGMVQTGTTQRAWVAQLLPNGALDSGLNDTGFADITLGESGAYYAITLEGNRVWLLGNMEFNPYNIDKQIVATRFIMGDLDAPLPGSTYHIFLPTVYNAAP